MRLIYQFITLVWLASCVFSFVGPVMCWLGLDLSKAVVKTWIVFAITTVVWIWFMEAFPAAVPD